jgi:excinuclease ABC subunit C
VAPTALRLSLPTTDLAGLRDRVRRLAEPRPGVYRMLDPFGRVLYVGKARRVKQRLLSYFHARYPDDKAARILHAAADITWDYVPSEFAAHVAELRQITRHRPPFNHHMNRARRTLFIKVSGGPAPRIAAGGMRGRDDHRWYGPFTGVAQVREAVRTLGDLLGLRDCAPAMPIVFAGQMDLFTPLLRAACPRHEFGFCTGPCAGLVTQALYHHRVETALAFLEGRTIQPLDRIVEEMQSAAESREFERATRWRQRFEQLEWLIAATSRARAAVAALTFVYRDPGEFGDDRAYLIRHGVVRASYPWPATPIEREAFQGVVRAELERPASPQGNLPFEHLDEILLLMAWFRRHPEAFRRTTRLESWVA